MPFDLNFMVQSNPAIVFRKKSNQLILNDSKEAFDQRWYEILLILSH